MKGKGQACRLLPLILLCLLLMLPGCGFKDIDKRFFVVALGIDLTENEKKPYRITLQLAVPSPKIEPGASKTQIESIEAPTISEGVRMVKAYVDKELDFGHCKVFVIGEPLARSDFADVLQWITRRRDIQSVADVAIGKPDAAALLRVQPVSERYPGNTLFLSFGKDGTESPYTYVESVSDFSRRASEKGLDPVVPIIRIDNKSSYIINRAALMNKQKIRLVLSPEETQLFNQIGMHFVKSSLHGMFEGTNLVLAITEIHSKYKFVKQSGGQETLVMNIKTNVVFEEAPKGLYEENWSAIEQQLAVSYSKSIEKLLRKIQKAGVDPLGFGLHYRATDHSVDSWERWQKIYPKLKFQVNTKVKIEGTGLIK
jgi:spore germination protein KC